MVKMDTFLAMVVFAFVGSATPGPVNIIGSMCGARFGAQRALGFVTGATVCFTALLLAFGIGMQVSAEAMTALTRPLTLLGAGYLLWLSWKLARSGGLGEPDAPADPPGFWSGISVQGMNPKAWLVALSAVSTFVLPLPDQRGGLVVFAGQYTVICWLSLAAWAWGGARLARRSLAGFNKVMAAMLVGSVIWMLAAAWTG